MGKKEKPSNGKNGIKENNSNEKGLVEKNKPINAEAKDEVDNNFFNKFIGMFKGNTSEVPSPAKSPVQPAKEEKILFYETEDDVEQVVSDIFEQDDIKDTGTDGATAEKAVTSEERKIPVIEKDKLTLDLEIAVINIIKDKNFKERLLKNYKDELESGKEEILSLKAEIERLNNEVAIKDNEIIKLKERVLIHQQDYSQLAADYKVYQEQALVQEEDMKRQIVKEQEKYKELSIEYENFETNQKKQYNVLKKMLTNQEIENRQLSEINNKIREEKDQLVKSINEFAQRMPISITALNKVGSQNLNKDEEDTIA